MCNSSNESCSPSAQMFQETISGNFNGTGATPVTVWTAPAGAYFSGTFEIFNSASSPAATPVTATTTPAGTGLTATPGYASAETVNQPTAFAITAPIGASGKFCITLYKRVLA
ncbi:S-Ena type endospore appendage [Priestia aryabhattai]|uniref:S-Ena type endospore appendage n=1 Tax=Priestia aryabhattai TaxID=412384 RepID=UPI0030C9DE57